MGEVVQFPTIRRALKGAHIKTTLRDGRTVLGIVTEVRYREDGTPYAVYADVVRGAPDCLEVFRSANDFTVVRHTTWPLVY